MSETILEKLKEEKKSFENIYKIYSDIKLGHKINLKKKEDELKSLKRAIYYAEKQRKYAKDKIAYLDRKIKSTPTQVRSWNKEHFGKVMERFEECQIQQI